jgi:hypothetical protein
VERTLLRVRLYVAGCAAVAGLALALSWSLAPPTDWPGNAVLSLLCVVSSLTRVRGVYERTDLGTSSIVLLAAVVVVGTTGAMVVAVVSWLPEIRRAQPRVWAMNTALFSLLATAAGLTFTICGGSRDPQDWSASTIDLLTHLAVPLLLADVVMCLTNAMLIAGIVSINQHTPFREVLSGTLRSGGIAYVGYGLFGLLLAVLWKGAEVGPLAASLVLVPLFVARWAFAQYADQNAAHERTVAALVQAVEAKDHYTRGHSERVARASVLIAREVGLSQQRTSTLHFAGMLHDVGKLGVPTRVLRKTGALTDEEVATIARHPVRGLEMVREIEFLGEALQGVLHHHERLDGRGYPMGLAGMSIPEFARIIAVADAFDSMTSTRSYRQARSVERALGELRECTGTQFDPQFVQGLAQALEHTTWMPTTAPELADDERLDGLELSGPQPPDSRDHDDPRFAIQLHQPIDLGGSEDGRTPW